MRLPEISKSQIRKFLFDSLKIFLLGAVLGVLMCPNCYKGFNKIGMVVSLFSGLIWVALWQGNSLVQSVVDLYLDWFKSPGKRFLIGLLATTAYTLTAVISIQYIFAYLLPQGYRISGFETETFFFSIGITLIIWFFLTGKEFLDAYRQIAVNAEKLKTENISSRYEALKNQVNPHFLFNSLNALSNLIYQDTGLSAKFIKQLSLVYRYVLDSREKDVVPIEDELQFLDSYIFLQKIRFGENLKISIQSDELVGSFIPPVSLQMLIENAIKHNIISAEDPLEIKIYREGDYLAVENNLQPKAILKEESLGVGLKNIKARYEILSQKEVHIDEENTMFRVYLPLIFKA